MTRTNRAARNYVPEQMRRLIRATERVERLQLELDNLSEEIALDIIDGWSTKDPLLDFAIVSCNGIYDPLVLELQYRRLFDLGLRNPGQKVMVVQQAEHRTESGVIILRNIHLAFLRADTLVTDINSLSMRLPVEPGRFVWKEFIKGDKQVSGHRIFHDTWLTTGPLYNDYCDYGATRKNEDEIFFVPNDAVCDIELLPDENLDLFEKYGVDSETLSLLHIFWIQDKRKK